MKLLPAQIIKKKRNGLTLSEEELKYLIESYTKNELPEYQMSAFLMAVFFKGMSPEETAWLTKIMKNSGRSFNFDTLKPKVIDKHSTGGVGDKASMILAPIAAAAGVYVPMIAGRGLGHTGGTLDKLESIPGFSTQLSTDKFESLVHNLGFAIMGQTKDICPADKKLYALRDVTATVESLPLICGSIMSKKLSEGINGLVLDVKYGQGAFMKTVEEASALAELLKFTGESNGVEVHALITNMEQPLGRFVGNALEIKECFDILSGSNDPLYSDTTEISLHLAAHMIQLAGIAKDTSSALKIAQQKLNDGSALEKFRQLCRQQGASEELENIPLPKNSIDIKADQSGFIGQFQNEKIGYLGVQLKAGRKQSSDSINMLSGFEFLKKMGDPVNAGDTIAKIYHDGTVDVKGTPEELKKYIQIIKEQPKVTPLIQKKII